jgi:hypothetical protein
MSDQLSWCLSDEVAPHFNSAVISSLCLLIDEKANAGMKYNDLKEQLLTFISSSVDLSNQANSFNVYRRAYEFARYY